MWRTGTTPPDALPPPTPPFLPPPELALRRTARCLVVAMLTLVGAEILPAQSPDDARRLADLDLAIGGDALPVQAPAGDSVAADLQVGLGELARYVATGDRRAVDRALARFDTATVRRPDWGWPEYALARAFLLLHDRGAPVAAPAGARPDEDHAAATMRHLTEALRRDPELGRARRLFIDLLLPSGDRLLRPETAALLETEVSRPDPIPEALLAWARHKRNTGNDRVALAILTLAADRGVDPSLVALERARALAALDDDTAAVEAYRAGTSTLTAAGRALYLRDASWTADPEQLAELDQLPETAMGEWLRRFWDERDLARMQPEGATLARHLRDWGTAHRHFRVPEPWSPSVSRGLVSHLAYWGDPCGGVSYDPGPGAARLPRGTPLPGDLRRDEPVLGSGGALLLRFGRPIAILRARGESEAEDSLLPASARALQQLLAGSRWKALWLYPSEGGYDLFLFEEEPVLDPSPDGFAGRLSVPEAAPAWLALERTLPRTLEGRDPPKYDEGALRRCRTALATLLAESAPAGPVAPPAGDPPAIVHPWTVDVGVLALGHEGVSPPRLLLTIAVPTTQVRDAMPPSGPISRLPIRFRVESYRREDGARIVTDTLRNFTVLGASKPWDFVYAVLEIPVTAGEWLVTVRTSPEGGPPGTGGFAVRGGLRIGEGAAELAISDILTGETSQPPVRTSLGSFPINHTGEWVEGSVVALRYVVYGIPAGAAWEQTTELINAEEWPEPSLRRVDSLQSFGIRSTLGRPEELGRLKPGRYWLVITARHAGREAVRMREIRIVRR